MSIRTASIQVDTLVTVGINCDNCGTDIPRVFPDAPSRGVQGIGMLTVALGGGYGEFMDGSGEAHLCKDCAETLLAAFPLLRTIADNSEIGGADWRTVKARD